jgi:D-arabinose 1-dehydrogenase-like Zn-dependent alcohol dehydrogenase
MRRKKMPIPSKSKCAVLEEFGKPLVIKELPIPDVEPGAMLIKTLLSTFCRSDIPVWQGQFRMNLQLPRIPGHEKVGEVVKLGQGVTKDWFGKDLELGDRIIFSNHACRRCYFCNVLNLPNYCQNKTSTPPYPHGKPPYLTGAFSEYIYVLPTCAVMKLPPEIGDEEASAATCAFRTVMRSFDLLGQIGTEDIILIQGAGNLGLCATAVADNSSARRVIVIDIEDQRLEEAKRFGADVTFNINAFNAEELQKQILELTDGRGPDIVMEYVNAAPAFKQGLELIRPGGRYIVTGGVDGTIGFAPGIISYKEINIKGVFSADIPYYYKAIEFIKNWKHNYPFKELVSNKYKLKDINKALYAMVEGRERKPGIVFE